MKYLLVIFMLFFSVLVSAQDWKQNYNEALEQAIAEDKPLILVFSGSDWCPPCKRLDKTIWTSEEFKKISSEKYVLYKADFPRKKINKLPQEQLNQNKKLAERFNPKGHYPLVLVLDESEQVLGTTGYQKISPEAYIAVLNSFL
ncbi:thioredoxin family protein [uncultured Croceitalea sp.]|uniref:thioredoxin family protein n=1 Tax=uncultured Croceitalea sp. TaxID=1798908 RepID=UPI00374EF6F2